jgi:hypothetical protein
MMTCLKDRCNYLKKANAGALLEPPVQDTAENKASHNAKDNVQADSNLDDDNEQNEDTVRDKTVQVFTTFENTSP